jgi:hypothetical protein
MSNINETRRVGDAAGLGDAISFAADATEQTTKPLHVQETIATLQRDFVAEALRIASIKAWHAADDLAIMDDDCAERGIRIAVLNLREAATGFRQLEALTAAIDALNGAGMVMERASP